MGIYLSINQEGFFLDKIEKVLRIGGDKLLGNLDDFELAIYSPILYEVNITPVVNELLKM